MNRSSRIGRSVALLAAVAAFVLVPTAAQADPSFYESPLFGTTTAPGNTLLVADAGQGVVNGGTGALVAPLPGVTDVAVRSGGGLWATTGAGEDPEEDTGQGIWHISGGSATLVANLFEYEEKVNPHPATVDSNPFDVADAGGGKALVADAGGNSILLVGDGNSPNSDVVSRVKLVATLPDELVSTANAKSIFGCPNGPPDICGLPPMIPAQPVATSVAVGPDGAYYVGELKGFPAPTGESRVWRIEPGARNVQCGESKKCTLVLDGFTSIIDLAFGPDGRLNVAQIDDASWLAMEIGVGVGGSVRSCDLATDDVSGECDELVDGVPILTSITYRGAALWGSILALVPGGADVVPLSP
ncbi:MAG: ScyD/ScyE family protein [Gaiellaceae bacterium]